MLIQVCTGFSAHMNAVMGSVGSVGVCIYLTYRCNVRVTAYSD